MTFFLRRFFNKIQISSDVYQDVCLSRRIINFSSGIESLPGKMDVRILQYHNLHLYKSINWEHLL